MFSLRHFAAAMLPLAALALPAVAHAQDAMTAIAPPPQPTAIALGTGLLPDAQNGES